jgi:hypothetical protein
MSRTYCSDGLGAGTPLLLNKYRIFSSCIFINTKLYAINDIIIVKNEDVWSNGDIDLGAVFAYLCKKNMTLQDVYPLKSYASPPPQALSSFNSTNEFWQQLSQQELQTLLRPNSQQNWFYAFLVVVIVLVIVLVLFASKSAIR